MQTDRERVILSARATLTGAVVALGGWLVSIVQGYLTYNRLMVPAHYRNPTLLEWILLTIGLLFIIAHLVLRLLLRGAPIGYRSQSRGRVTTLRLATLVALFAGWYGAAVAQWYLVIQSASVDPGAYVRDPTILEHLLTAGGVIALLALVARRFLK